MSRPIVRRAARLSWAMGCGLLLLTPAARAGDPTFTYVDLGTLGGPESVAMGLNESGQVVGWAMIDGCTAQGHPCRRAFLWEDGVMTDLGLLAGDEESVARAINDAGFVVGTSESDVVFGSGTFHAFQWDGAMSALPDLGLGQSFAHDVNDAGLVAGSSNDPGTARDTAVTWLGGVVEDVGKTEPHSYSRAYGVSEGGVLVGFAWNLFSPNDAILFDGGVWSMIGGFGQFQNAEAYDVTDTGYVCGLQAFPSGSWHACLWTPGGALDLGLLAGHDTSELYDVNDAGLAVGRSYDTFTAASRAIFWDGTTLHDLEDLVAPSVPGVLFEAREINEAGDIVGTSLVDGFFRAFLMVREPWEDLGGGSPGVNGVPHLAASGDMTAGTPLTLALSDAAPGALTAGWLSFSSTPVDVLGGTLHANPKTVQILRTTDGAGDWSQTLTWPAGIPAGLELWVQFLVQDLSVPAEITLSNAITAVTP